MKFLHSFSDPQGRSRISPWVWMVLLLSAGCLVVAVLLANLQVSVVAIGLLNPLSFGCCRSCGRCGMCGSTCCCPWPWRWGSAWG